MEVDDLLELLLLLLLLLALSLRGAASPLLD